MPNLGDLNLTRRGGITNGCRNESLKNFDNHLPQSPVGNAHRPRFRQMTPVRIRARLGSFPRSYLTPTASFDDGLSIPTAKRARWCSFNIRYVDPSLEPRQGYLRHPASSNRPRFSCRPPHYDPRTLPPAQRERTANSRRIGHGGQRSGLRRSRTRLR